MIIAFGTAALVLGGGGLAYALAAGGEEGGESIEVAGNATAEEQSATISDETAPRQATAGSEAEARLDALAADLDRQAEAIDYAMEGKEVPAELRGIEARLTCGVGSQRMPLIACFAGNSGLGSYGKLAVKSAGQTRIYEQVDFHELEFSGAERVFPLSAPFAVVAQAGGNPAYTLRVELLDKGQLIASDRAMAHGIASVGG